MVVVSDGPAGGDALSFTPETNSDGDEDDEEDADTPLPLWLDGDSLAPPCQADMDVVRAIIDFADVTADDVLYDLGCGDGRICIEAAESRGARACGVEIEEHLVNKFRRRVASRELESKVSVIHGDLRDVDLSEATVVVTYLLPQAMTDIAETHLIPLLRRESFFPLGTGGTTDGEPATREQPLVGGHEAQSYGVKSQGPFAPVGCSEFPVKSTQLERNHTSSHRILGIREDSARNITNSSTIAAAAAVTTAAAAAAAKDCVQKREEDSAEGMINDVPEGRTVGRPRRIVCNTWGIPGLVPAKEAAVGLYMGVRLRLFTRESLT